MWLGKMPPVAPKQREGQYITFLAFVRVGVNLLLSRFTEEVLDSYEIRLGNLVPNSIVMLATFAYLCEALVGVRSCVELWHHFFVLWTSGGFQEEFGSCRFQSRSSPRMEYIHCDFTSKWEHWRESWFYLRTKVNHRLRVPHRVSPSKSWEACPLIDDGWRPVLSRIEALRASGLHTSVLVAHYTSRRIAPLQEHTAPLWLFFGMPTDAMCVSATDLNLEAVSGVVRSCVSKSGVSHMVLVPGLEALEGPPSADAPGGPMPETMLEGLVNPLGTMYFDSIIGPTPAKRIRLGASRSKAGASAGARDAPGASRSGTVPSSSLPEQSGRKRRHEDAAGPSSGAATRPEVPNIVGRKKTKVVSCRIRCIPSSSFGDSSLFVHVPRFIGAC